jgi:hypothetical protein
MLVFVLCGLWHGAAWHWLVYGLYNGALMSLHRALDRQFTGATWRTTVTWKFIAWAGTVHQLLIGLVLIRMADWSGGLVVMRALVGFGHDPVGGAAFTTVPLPVYPLLVLGLAGHLYELLPRRNWLNERFEVVRGMGYATAVVLLVTLGPGVSKSFIYIAF